MSQYISVRILKGDSELYKTISDKKSMSYSQLFTDFFVRIAKNPIELGAIIVSRLTNSDLHQPSSDTSNMMNLYLGRDNLKKFMEISDITLLSRAALATLIIQTIIANNKDLLKDA